MFAVIKTGGKQYKVAANDLVRIEKIPGEAGEAITFENVLMVGGDKDLALGTPLVSGALVAGEVVEQFRDKKVIIFKKKRRQGYRRKNGHRQELTLVRITEILTGGAKPSAKKAAAPKAAAKTETKAAQAPEAEKPAAKQAAKKTEAKAETPKAEAKAKPAPKKAAAKPAAEKVEAKAPAEKAPAKKPAAKKAPAKKADKE